MRRGGKPGVRHEGEAREFFDRWQGSHGGEEGLTWLTLLGLRQQELSRWLEVVAGHKHQLLKLEELLYVLQGERGPQCQLGACHSPHLSHGKLPRTGASPPVPSGTQRLLLAMGSRMDSPSRTRSSSTSSFSIKYLPCLTFPKSKQGRLKM